jgi:hypothetical protein
LLSSLSVVLVSLVEIVVVVRRSVVVGLHARALKNEYGDVEEREVSEESTWAF